MRERRALLITVRRAIWRAAFLAEAVLAKPVLVLWQAAVGRMHLNFRHCAQAAPYSPISQKAAAAMRSPPVGAAYNRDVLARQCPLRPRTGPNGRDVLVNRSR
jgi:hypothetical protein